MQPILWQIYTPIKTTAMSQKYKSLVLNLAVKEMTFTSAAIQTDGNKIMATLSYSGLESDAITSKLLQSIDNINYSDVPDSLVTIDKRVPSHTWNVNGLVHGCFIKVYVTVPFGTSEGTFDLFNLLAHD